MAMTGNVVDVEGSEDEFLVDTAAFAFNTIMRHLHRLKSDHQPVLISTHPESSVEGVLPFRFLSNWLTHPKFRDVVLKSWSNDADIAMDLENFTQLIQVWN
ncbi:hypothetical protein J1N35_012290 [Gossypium stocksii]|uniref:Uncharacterized protein n=1 Tax=Gossypium stocksii TaxID=47602 RepID=A0A9D4AC95_9ROSI|nr:hypothetical protein J1N35_012290 [Gossypium stocksii]